MSKFLEAMEAGYRHRSQIEMAAYQRRREIENNPDPEILAAAKDWVYTELPRLIRNSVLHGWLVGGLSLHSATVPDDYLWLVCKDIPELVVSEEILVAYWPQAEAVASFMYKITALRYPA